MFIGRETELKFLEDRYKGKTAQLIVLYGRRRVGKTETLREFCKGKPHIFFSCTQSTDKAQLVKFSKQLLQEDIPARQYISECFIRNFAKPRFTIPLLRQSHWETQS